MINRSFFARVRSQDVIQDFAFRLSESAMEKQVFAPGCYHCLQSEHGPIVETLVKANAGCAVAEINQAKVAHQFKKLIPVFLIHGNLGHYGDGTVVDKQIRP